MYFLNHICNLILNLNNSCIPDGHNGIPERVPRGLAAHHPALHRVHDARLADVTSCAARGGAAHRGPAD